MKHQCPEPRLQRPFAGDGFSSGGCPKEQVALVSCGLLKLIHFMLVCMFFFFFAFSIFSKRFLLVFFFFQFFVSRPFVGFFVGVF